MTTFESLSDQQFARVWATVFYVRPGLHPDDLDAEGSGWPDYLRPLAVEAWARYQDGRMTEAEFYPTRPVEALCSPDSALSIVEDSLIENLFREGVDESLEPVVFVPRECVRQLVEVIGSLPDVSDVDPLDPDEWEGRTLVVGNYSPGGEFFSRFAVTLCPI